MRGNALVLKTPVENAPRTSVEKHLSWSSDIPPAPRLTLHRLRPAEYQPKPTNLPPSTRRSGRERHDDESDDDEGGTPVKSVDVMSLDVTFLENLTVLTRNLTRSPTSKSAIAVSAHTQGVAIE